MYGNAIVAGASVKFLTADLILGAGLSGDNFAGYMISIGDSLAPIELHAGISFGELVELSLFQGEPLPEGVSADYFSTLDPQVLEKLLKDLGIED